MDEAVDLINQLMMFSIEKLEELRPSLVLTDEEMTFYDNYINDLRDTLNKFDTLVKTVIACNE